MTKKMLFYDTHAHLDFPEFGADLTDVLDRARAAGIGRIITVGTDIASSERAIELCEQYEEVYSVVGWHPSQALEAPVDLRPALRAWANHPKVVAIGETGLDYHWLPSTTKGGTVEEDQECKRRQADLFLQHLEVASETGLNCVVHQRDAFEPTLALFQGFADRLKAVFHCFGQDRSAMEQVMALGSLVSFTGVVTFKNAQLVRTTAAAVPPERFMLETDCPYLAPVPYRGKRSEPAHVAEIATVIAALRGISLEELSCLTCATAQRFFPRLR